MAPVRGREPPEKKSQRGERGGGNSEEVRQEAREEGNAVGKNPPASRFMSTPHSAGTCKPSRGGSVWMAAGFMFMRKGKAEGSNGTMTKHNWEFSLS